MSQSVITRGWHLPASPVTPVRVLRVRHGRLEHTLYFKDERTNPTGSIKDRPARALVEAALSAGALDFGRGLVESTSGNLGAALARVACHLGIRFRAIVDPNLSPDLAAKITSYAGEIDVVGRPDAAGNFLAARIERAQELVATGDWVWTNQYSGDAAVRVHLEHTGPEIAGQLPDGFDELLVASSTCGTLSGIGQFVHATMPSTRVVAVDVEGSVVFGRRPARRVITGIGSTRQPEFDVAGCYDDIAIVPEAAAVEACLRLRQRTGVGVGTSTGAVLAAYFRRIAHCTSPTRTLVFIADGAENYRHTTYSRRWRRAHGFAPR